MDSSTLSSLVEEVLLGRPSDPSQFTEQLTTLHESLKSAAQSSLTACQKVAEGLVSQSKLAESDLEAFKLYLKNIKSSTSPPLKHLPLVNSGQKAAILCQALAKIHLKSQCQTHFAFNSISLHKIKEDHKLQIKRLNCARLVSSLRSSLGMRLQKTVDLLNFESFQKLSIEKKVVQKMKHSVKTVTQEEIVSSDVDLSNLRQLGDKAMVFAESKKLAVLKWKNKLLKQQLDNIPKDPVKAEREKYITTLLRSTFRYYKSREQETLLNWRHKAETIAHQESAKKVEKLMKALGNGLSHDLVPSFRLNPRPDMKNEALKKTMKILLQKLSLALRKNFGGWSKNVFSAKKNQKIKECLLKNLAKYPKMHFLVYFTTWKENKKNESPKLFKMINVLHRLMCQRTKKVYNPPRVIKDADAILRKSINDVVRIKRGLVREALGRWRFFKIMNKNGEKIKNHLAGFLNLVNPTRKVFNNWRITTLIDKGVSRSIALRNTYTALNRLYRNIYRTLVKKALSNKTKLEITNKVWNKFSLVYIEKLRQSYMTWKTLLISSKGSAKNHSATFYILKMFDRIQNNQNIFFQHWKKVVHGMKKKEYFNSFRYLKIGQNLSKLIRTAQRATLRSILPNNKIRSMIRMLFYSLIGKQRHSVYMWKTWVEIQKQAGQIKKLRVELLGEGLRKLAYNGLDAAKDCLLKRNEILGRSVKLLLYSFKSSGSVKDAFTIWRLFTIGDKHKALLNIPRRANLKSILEKVAKRTLQSTRKSLGSYESKVTAAFKSYSTVAKKLKRISTTKWIKFTLMTKTSVMLTGNKSARLDLLMRKLMNRILKLSIANILGGGNRVKGALNSMLHNIRKRPTRALAKWIKFADDCENKKLFDNARSQKLNNALKKVPVRTSKDVLLRVLNDDKIVNSKLKMIMMALNSSYKRAFFVWKDFVKQAKEKELLKNLTSNKLFISLNRLPARTLQMTFKRMIYDEQKVGFNFGVRIMMLLMPLQRKTLRTTFNRTVGTHDKGKRMISRVFYLIEKKSHIYFLKWKQYMSAIKDKMFLDGARTLKMEGTLNRVPKMTLKDAIDRIIGDGNKAKGTIKRSFYNLLKKPRSAIMRWVKYSQEVDKKSFHDANTSLKLKICMENIVKRTTRSASRRILGAGDVIKGAMENIMNNLKKKPRIAIIQWKEKINDIKNKKLLDNARSQQLKNALANLPKRCLKDAAQRIVGDGSKVKGALQSLLSNLKKKPRDAIRMWKDYLNLVKNKKLFDNMRSQKLNNVLKGIPNRIMRDSVKRIVGDGNTVKATLNSMISKVERRLRDANNKWKQFVNDVKNKNVMDNLRSQKLQNCMDRIPRRVVKDAKERILGDGNKVKGAIKTILNTIKNKPRQAYNLWKAYKESCDKKEILDNVRSQKLQNCLSRIPVRRLRDAAQRILGEGEKVKGALKSLINAVKQTTKSAYNKWKDFVNDVKLKKQLDNTRSQQLRNILERIPRRTIKDAGQRLLGDGSKVKGALKSILNNLRNKGKNAIQQWIKYSKAVDSKKLLDNIVSQKLKNALSRIPNRTLRDGFQRLIGDGSKLKGALKSMIHNIQKRPRDALEKWRKYLDACNQKSIMDNLRSQKLKVALTRIPLRTARDSHQRVVGGGSKAIGVLKSVFLRLEKQSYLFFFIWKDFIKATKTKSILNNLKSQKLKNNLSHIILRTMLGTFKDIHGKTAQIMGEIRAYKLLLGFLNLPRKVLRGTLNNILNKDERVKNAMIRIFNFILTSTRRSFLHWNKVIVLIKNNDLIDNVKSQKLLNALNKVPRRTLKDAVNRIIGDGDKTAGLIKRAIGNILRRPKSAILRWVKYSQEVDKKSFHDANTSLKLKICMENIVKRTTRSASRRILGAGDVIKGAMENIMNNLKKKPRIAINQWKEKINDIKNKKLLDNARSQQLKNALANLPKRCLKDAAQRIVGDGSKVKGALQSLLSNLKKKPRDAIRMWKDYLNLVKNKKLFDNMRSQKLNNVLKGIPNRIMRDSVKRIIGDGNTVKATLNSMISKVERRLRDAHNKWKQFVNDVKNKKVMDNLRSQKLQNCMDRIPRRVVKDAKERILGDGNKVKGAIKTILNSIKNKPRQAVNLWKAFKESCDKREILDNVRSHKLQNCLSRIPVRKMRDAAQRILGDGEKVKGALKSIVNSIKQKSRSAYERWKDFVNDVKLKKQFDNSRSQQLRNILEKIPRRTIKDAGQRLLGDGSKVKGALKGLLNNLRNKGKNAIQQWIKYSKAVDSKQLLDNIISQKLKNALSRIPNRTLRDGFQRLIGDGSKLKGALKSMIHNIQKRPKYALEKWRKYLEACNQKSIMDNLRSQKLKVALTRIPLRTARDSYQRVVGGGSKAAGVLKSIFLRLEKQSYLFFYSWKDYVKLCNTKSLMSNIKSQKLSFNLFKILLRSLTSTFVDVSGKNSGMLGEIRSYKLLLALSRLDRRTLRASYNNIIMSDDKIKAALIRIFNFITQTTRRSFVHWTKISLLIKQQVLLDGVKSQKLLNALTRVPKRTLKDAFNTTIGDGNASKGLIVRAVSRILRKPKLAISKWVKYSQCIDKKTSLDAIRTLKLKEAMTNILKRTLRDTDQRIIGGGDKIKGHLTNLMNSLKRKPKEAINQWRKYIADCASRKIMDNLRSQKLKGVLAKVPRRVMRDAVQRITGDGSKVKGAVNSLLSNLKKKPKDAINMWKKYLNDVKTKGLLDNLKAQKVKISLSNIVKRTLRDSSQRVLGDGNKLKAVFASLELKIRQRERVAFKAWNKYLDDIKSKKLMDNVRSEKLKNVMTNIPRRTIKDAKERILGDGNKVKGALKSILNAIKNKPRQAISLWKDYLANVKLGKILSNARNQKFLTILSNIVRRTSRDSCQRMLGEGTKVKGAIKSILNAIKQQSRSAFNKWLKFLEDIRLKKHFDGARSLKLNMILLNIPRRVIKDVVNRVAGEGDKVKGAMKNILNSLKKKVGQGFTMWKKAVDEMKGKGLLDNIRSQKLKFALTRIVIRTVKDTFERVIGDGSKVKGALKSILNKLRMLPKNGFDQWKKYVELCKQKMLFDGVRSQRLKIVMKRLSVKTEKDCFMRIAGGGSKALGAMKVLFMALDKLPKRAFVVWKDFVNAVKHRNLGDIVRSQKLKSAMSKLPARTLRDVFKGIVPEKVNAKGALRGIFMVFENGLKSSLSQWKNSVKDHHLNLTKQQIRGLRLRESVQIPIRKVKRTVYISITNKQINVKSALFNMANRFSNRLRETVKKWVDYKNQVAKNLLLNAIKTQKLKNALENIKLRTIRDASQRVLGFGDKMRAALERLDKSVDRKKNMAMFQWRKYSKAIDSKTLMNNSRALKLSSTLFKIQQRTVRSTHLRITGAGNLAKGLLTNLFKNLEKVPQRAFLKWKDFISMVKCKGLFDNARSAKLENKLKGILSRTLLSTLDKFSLDQMNKAKNVVKDLIRGVVNRQKDAWSQWKNFVEAVNKKGMLREAQSQKLKAKLAGVVMRKIRDAYSRTVGGGDKIAGRFALFNKAIERMKKIAVDNWKDFINGVKQKRFMDNIRALKLKTSMQNIVKRTSKSMANQIIGDGNKTKGALRRLFMMLDKQTKLAFSQWVNFMLRAQGKTLLNTKRGAALKSCLESLVKRSTKSVVYAVRGVNEKLQRKMKDLARFGEKLLRDSYSQWKELVSKFNTKEMQDQLRGEKIRRLLDAVARSVTQVTVRRIKDGGSRVMGLFRRLFNANEAKMRESFMKYRLWTLSKSHKMKAISIRLGVLTKVVLMRTLRKALDSIIGDSRVRRLLNRLVNNYVNIQKEAVKILWHRVEKVRTIKKINSAYYVFRSLLAYAKRVQAVRFTYWKNLEFLRRRRIMRKSVAKMMTFSSVSYESGFWKWKYVLSSTGFQLLPKHSLAFKKMILIGSNYQKRLEQFSFYRLALWYKNMSYGHKMKISDAVAVLSKHSRDFSQDDQDKHHLDPTKSVEHPSHISTVASGKLSNEEVSSINQLGALEMMFTQLKGARIRNISWGMCSILTYSRQIGFYDNERSRLIDQINELRFEKHSLLEDNNTLRHHNESLIENLEKTNLEFQTLSLHLDQMRLVRMVRVVSKMIEVPMAEAFSYLYENNLD